MAKSEFKILDLFPETLGTTFDFSGTYVDAGGTSHTLEVFDSDYFYDEIRANHECRTMLVPEDEEDTWLAEIFATWKASRLQHYLKQAYAFSLKYNPIENYSSHEVMTNDQTVTQHGHVLTMTKGSTSTATDTRKEEFTPRTSDTITTTPTDTSTDAIAAFNSSSLTNVKSTTNGGTITETTTHVGKDSTDHSGAITTVGSGSDTDTHSGSDTETRNYTLDKTGNIGVQTASEMLQREYDGLKMDLARRALYEFLDRYTYIAEEVVF